MEKKWVWPFFLIVFWHDNVKVQLKGTNVIIHKYSYFFLFPKIYFSIRAITGRLLREGCNKRPLEWDGKNKFGALFCALPKTTAVEWHVCEIKFLVRASKHWNWNAGGFDHRKAFALRPWRKFHFSFALTLKLGSSHWKRKEGFKDCN